jgi:magnesium-protoporphyrin O-methyltransferase
MTGTNHFFNKQARRLEKYFRNNGLRPEQKHLMQGIQQSGMTQANILEIGCGVGGLHLSLLQAGAGRAVGFDISEKMIQTAQKLSHEMGLQERTQYWQGDFVEMHEHAPTAEVTILDKVICCYENFEELIARSAAKTKRIYAVCYPRKNFIARFVICAASLLLKLSRMSFHPYYHAPQRIQATIQRHGFDKVFERRTAMWVVQVFQRN